MSFVGDTIKKVTGSLGLTADPNAGAQAQQQALTSAQGAADLYSMLQVPGIAEQLIPDLALTKYIESSPEERLAGTAFENIQEDPQLRQRILDALDELQQRGEVGLTTEDRARYQALQEMSGADEKARQEFILQQMAQRGALDSGAQLASQLASNQAQTTRMAQQGRDLAAEAARARREALGQAANVASNLRSEDYRRSQNLASAKDQIAAFNAAVAARDTGSKRSLADQNTAAQRQYQYYKAGLPSQQFQQQYMKAGGQAGAQTNLANMGMQQAGAQAQAAQQEAAGIRGLLGSGLGFAFEHGGYKKMGYEEGGIQTDGRIVPEDETLPKHMNFDGDNLPDKINAGEMVLNLDQQQNVSDTIINLMKQLENLRADEAVASGMAEVNEPQQEALMRLAKGEISPEQFPKDTIVRPTQEATSKLMQLLKMGR